MSGVYLECENLGRKKIQVINLSELGIGVETSEITPVPGSGAEFEAKLTVGYMAVPVMIKLVHLTKNVAGFEFIESLETIQKIIKTYFEPELVGASLKLTQSAKDSLAYEDSVSNKVEIQLSGQTIKSVFISVLGNSVKWVQGSEPVFIQNDIYGPVPDLLREQLVRLVRSGGVIDALHREQLEKLFKLNGP